MGVGNTSSLGMQVGLSTFPGVVVGGSTTALMVSGNARITGVTTFGTGSITINKSPDYIEGVNVLTAGRVNATNKFVGNLEGNVTGNVTGVATGAEKLVGSPGIIAA